MSALLDFLELSIIRAQWDNNEAAMSHAYREHITAALLSNKARQKIPAPGTISSLK
ncbi:MAG: hypothetical protein O2971_20065 [Proteobacteria bacterium]|nr:hypothetical protein [Pseudomonadota bacterium]